MTGNIADLLEVAERECQRLAGLNRPLTAEERASVEAMRQAAENTLEPLFCGLEALGELMTLTLSADEVVGRKTVAGLGWLLVNVSWTVEGSWRVHKVADRTLSPSG